MTSFTIIFSFLPFSLPDQLPKFSKINSLILGNTPCASWSVWFAAIRSGGREQTNRMEWKLKLYMHVTWGEKDRRAPFSDGHRRWWRIQQNQWRVRRDKREIRSWQVGPCLHWRMGSSGQNWRRGRWVNRREEEDRRIREGINVVPLNALSVLLSYILILADWSTDYLFFLIS